MSDHSAAPLPLNDVTTFGDARHAADASTPGGHITCLDFIAEAPAPAPSRPRPAVTRVLSADGANHIVFTFLPGQTLPDHKAAHPITVQVLRGAVTFGCEGTDYPLTPGRAVHLPAYLPHSVTAPGELNDNADALDPTEEPTVMLLTMHTGAQVSAASRAADKS
ncbi:cupin domain-containing protein [uncultured Corynebacterium sp.]|uniref:cupin domain-containing protein n=1 Tax=uncultured Corynebacterium sp. TaxID=159447 RepID=UPI0025E5129D|nr:cupin domain-containing protein [uncultured Corynebacterium sp.]